MVGEVKILQKELASLRKERDKVRLFLDEARLRRWLHGCVSQKAQPCRPPRCWPPGLHSAPCGPL